MPSTVVTGAVLFAAAGAWPLARAKNVPDYTAVVLPSMLLWGMANALIQPSLFASADAAPQAQLASGSAVLSMARQLGSAVGVAVFVAVLGDRPAGDLTGFHRAWIVVLITAAMTAAAGLAAGQRMDRVPQPAAAKTAPKLTQPGRQLFLVLREEGPGQARGNTAAASKCKIRHIAAAISDGCRASALATRQPGGRGCWLRSGNVPSGSPPGQRHRSCGHPAVVYVQGPTHPERS